MTDNDIPDYGEPFSERDCMLLDHELLLNLCDELRKTMPDNLSECTTPAEIRAFHNYDIMMSCHKPSIVARFEGRPCFDDNAKFGVDRDDGVWYRYGLPEYAESANVS